MFGYVRPVKRLDNREREARGVLPVYPLPLTLTVGERRLERRLGPRGYERASWTPQRDRSPGRSPSRTLRPMTVLSGPRARRARSGLRRRVSDAVVLSGPFWPASGAFRLRLECRRAAARSRSHGGPSRLGGEELPLVGDASKGLEAPIVELQAGPRD